MSIYSLNAVVFTLLVAAVLGLRQHVGTDYNSYYKMFSTDSYKYLLLKG